MIFLTILIIQLVILFFIARALTTRLYLLIFLITRSKSIAMTFILLLLFPGTVIHELAHLFTAEILGVKTGKLTLAPESVRGEEVQAGMITMAKTDPFRKTIIGIAPLIVGLIAFSIISYWIPSLLSQLQAITPASWLSSTTFYLVIGACYLLFAVSNSLFPSSLDLEGTPTAFIIMGVIVLAAYVTGVRVSLSGRALDLAKRILTSLTQSTTLVLALDGVLLLIVWIFLVLSGKVLRRRLV